MHYQRMRNNGTTSLNHKLSVLERFMRFVDKAEGCWAWKGNKDDKGRGRFWNGRRQILSSRAAYELLVGSIPDGLLICHHCDNPNCVRPSHLFLGTQAQNMQDMIRKGRKRINPCRGEKSSSAKLTNQQVIEIRQLISSGVSLSEIGRRFGVWPQTILNIKIERTWRSLENCCAQA
jgi:hypothetical protein